MVKKRCGIYSFTKDKSHVFWQQAMIALTTAIMILVVAVLLSAVAGEMNNWKSEGDSEGINWLRFKAERWERERREKDRRILNVPVDYESRQGVDRRKKKD